MRTLRLAASAAAGAAVALPAAGCYTLQPARGVAPAVGTRVAFDVNDAGRVALGGSMGPEIAQVQGRLLEQANGEYLVAVSAIRLLRGGEQPWRGEEVRIGSGHVTTTYVRRLSRGRTIAAGAAGAAVVAFFITRALRGGGDVERPTPIDSAQTRRVPWR